MKKKTTCESCLESFLINEDEVFYDPNVGLFLMPCPICGDLVEVDEDQLSLDLVARLRQEAEDDEEEFEEYDDGFSED